MRREHHSWERGSKRPTSSRSPHGRDRPQGGQEGERRATRSHRPMWKDRSNDNAEGDRPRPRQEGEERRPYERREHSPWSKQPRRPQGRDDDRSRERREEGGGYRKEREDRPRRFEERRRESWPERPRPTKVWRDPARFSFPSPSTYQRQEGERIAKVIARAGLCSRRDAEAWIEAGRIEVNGEILQSPARNVIPQDIIKVDGQPMAKQERTRLWLFHKPRGLVTTARDPEGRPTVFDSLPEGMPRVVSIGRLDINTEGLLLFTNDGGLARILELPSTGWLRRYRVRANGWIDPAVLDELQHGITIDGMEYAGIEAQIDRVQGANTWLTLGLREGKNREIKRILEHLGLNVNRLIRISFGPFQLGQLEEGGLSEVPLRVILDQLGPELAAEAQLDTHSPVSAKVVTRERHVERRRTAPPRYEVQEERPGRPDRPRRKHVSTLRQEREDQERAGPRQRISRSHTQDRQGRPITVESHREVREGRYQKESRSSRSPFSHENRPGGSYAPSSRFRQDREQKKSYEKNPPYRSKERAHPDRRNEGRGPRNRSPR